MYSVVRFAGREAYCVRKDFFIISKSSKVTYRLPLLLIDTQGKEALCLPLFIHTDPKDVIVLFLRVIYGHNS